MKIPCKYNLTSKSLHLIRVFHPEPHFVNFFEIVSEIENQSSISNLHFEIYDSMRTKHHRIHENNI